MMANEVRRHRSTQYLVLSTATRGCQRAEGRECFSFFESRSLNARRHQSVSDVGTRYSVLGTQYSIPAVAA